MPDDTSGWVLLVCGALLVVAGAAVAAGLTLRWLPRRVEVDGTDVTASVRRRHRLSGLGLLLLGLTFWTVQLLTG
ncbi:hypothetical protein [Pseudokineococcus sp. 1T1Z-3]|uniref:hypothetical protein n=1 Tax=Pseudokineococcus sp. 1T1Z-3 TaxID=3132745 RepID=UPI00309C47C2